MSPGRMQRSLRTHFVEELSVQAGSLPSRRISFLPLPLPSRLRVKTGPRLGTPQSRSSCVIASCLSLTWRAPTAASFSFSLGAEFLSIIQHFVSNGFPARPFIHPRPRSVRPPPPSYCDKQEGYLNPFPSTPIASLTRMNLFIVLFVYLPTGVLMLRGFFSLGVEFSSRFLHPF